MSRRRSVSRRANQEEYDTDEEKPHELDGYNTEEEGDRHTNNIDIHEKWLSKAVDKNDREMIADTKKRWKRMPLGLQKGILNHITEVGRSRFWEIEQQKKLIHDIAKSYNDGRNLKNNKFGHAIDDDTTPCCTKCGKTLCGKVFCGKNYCEPCKQSHDNFSYYFEKNEYDKKEIECEPPKEGGYKRTRRRKKKNRKKRTKKKARRKRRRKSSKRRRRRKR
jgi:hypothetical protein